MANNYDMFTPEILATAQHSVLCWLATCDASGQPNVSPKEVWKLLDPNRVVVANIASPCTVGNIEANAAVCLSFVDVFRQKGFKLQGTARNVKPAQTEFGQLSQPLVELSLGKFPIHSVIVIQVDTVSAIVAPSYWMFPEVTSEESQIASSMQTYGVRSAK